jgi:hypothetical protein
MLPEEFYSLVKDKADHVHGQLHRLRADGNWIPPLPEVVEPPAELAMRSTLGAAGLLTRSALRATERAAAGNLARARSSPERRARSEEAARGAPAPVPRRPAPGRSSGVVHIGEQYRGGAPVVERGSGAIFICGTLRIGQILDALSDVVRKNPSWFRWDARDVTPAAIERMEKLQRLEREGDQAVR